MRLLVKALLAFLFLNLTKAQASDDLGKLDQLQKKFNSIASEIVPYCPKGSNLKPSNRDKSLKRSKNLKRSKIFINRQGLSSLRRLAKQFNQIRRELQSLVKEIGPVCAMEYSPVLGLASVRLVRDGLICKFSVAANHCYLLFVPAAFVKELKPTN